MRLKLSLLLPFLLAFSAFGQEGPTVQSMPFVQYPYQLGEKSFAEWIVPVGEEDEGVFYFRKKINLGFVPEQFLPGIRFFLDWFQGRFSPPGSMKGDRLT